MYVVIFCLGLVLVALEIVASKKNARTAAASPPGWWWLRAYRWRYLIGAPLATASAFVSYPLASGADNYQVTGFPFLVMAIDQRGFDYTGFLSLPSLVANALVWLYLPSIALWSTSRSRQTTADSRTTTDR